MTPLLFLLASVAGGAGAGLRYLVDVGVMRLAKGRFPWGIVVVNITGAFALGLVTSLIPAAAYIVGAGLLGGYTTFSTSVLDAVGLWKDGARAAAAGQVLVTFGASVLAAIAGLALGALI